MWMNEVTTRGFYLADLLAANLTSIRCPNCNAAEGQVVHVKHSGLGTIRRCRRCRLLYRPSAFAGGKLERLYYERIYRPERFEAVGLSRVTARERAAAGGKDRSHLAWPMLKLVRAPSLGVLGASWGYELACLEREALSVWGIEPGGSTRAGARALGYDVFESIGRVPADMSRGGLLLSSHVIEHMTKLDAALDEIDDRLQPDLQIHITPRCDPADERVWPIIGRQHPIGVTVAYWRERASRTNRPVWLYFNMPANTRSACELVCVVGSEAVPSLQGLVPVGIDGKPLELVDP